VQFPATSDGGAGDPVGILQSTGKTRMMGYHMLKKVWWCIKPFRHDTGTWQTERHDITDQLQPVAATESHRRLRSSTSARLDIPRARRTTIDDHAFCVTSHRVRNSLSSSTQNAPSLPVFRRLLKCELFRRCYGSHLC